MSPEEFVQRYQADVAGAVCAVQQVVPSMKEKKEGTILFTGGGLAFDPAPEYVSVSIHKAALRTLAVALHKELETDGIYIGIVNIKGNIGSDNYYSPENIAKVFISFMKKRILLRLLLRRQYERIILESKIHFERYGETE